MSLLGKISSKLTKHARMAARRSGIGKSPKVFGIGRNKTGTTSLQVALKEFGYFVAPTREGEVLLPEWIGGNYDAIVDFCRSYDAFQDIPFSVPGTYEKLDQAFPGSKFILTVRDSADQWFDSLCRFHAKLFGTDGNVPNWDQVRNADYRYPGFLMDCHKYIYNSSEQGLYNKEAYQAHYCNYNDEVRRYFQDRADDFLEINVGNPDSFQQLCRFLNVDSEAIDFPWANRTEAG